MTIYPSDRVTSGRSAMGASPAALAAVQAALAANTAADAANTAADAANAALDALQATDIAALLALAHPPASVAPATNPALSLDTVNQVFNLDLTTPGSYDNTTSGLTADNIQGALDELATLLAASALEIQDHNTTVETNAIKMNITGNTVQVSSVASGELKIAIDSGIPGSYDNSISGLLATSIQSAIDELALYPKGAFNGTSIAMPTQQVQLGNDVGGTDAALQSDREIPMMGQNIFFKRNDGGTSTVVQGDGSVEIGNQLLVRGDHDGTVGLPGYAQARIGDAGQELRTGSLIQQSGKTSTGEYTTRNEFLVSGNDPLGLTPKSYLEWAYTGNSGGQIDNQMTRGWRYDGLDRLVNMLGSSRDGLYKLGAIAQITGTALPSENPAETTIADAGNIKNLVFNIATGDIKLEGTVNLNYRKIEKAGTQSLTAYPTTPTATNGGKHYYEIVETLVNTPVIPFAAPIGKKWMVRINGNVFPQFVSPKNVNAETFSYLRVNGILLPESQDITPIVADTGSADTSTVVAANRLDCVADVNQTVSSTSPVAVVSYIRHDVGETISMPISNSGSDQLGYWNLAVELFLADL